MTQINLLPWREELKREYLAKFVLLTSALTIIAVSISIAIHIYLKNSLSHTTLKIQFLEIELKYESERVDKLNQEVSKFQKNEQSIKQLIREKNNNFRIVKLIDQIPKILPKSISLTTIAKDGNQIKISGNTYSNSDITLFIKSLSRIGGYSQANLTDITESTANPEEKSFELYFNEIPL